MAKRDPAFSISDQAQLGCQGSELAASQLFWMRGHYALLITFSPGLVRFDSLPPTPYEAIV